MEKFDLNMTRIISFLYKVRKNNSGPVHIFTMNSLIQYLNKLKSILTGFSVSMQVKDLSNLQVPKTGQVNI